MAPKDKDKSDDKKKKRKIRLDMHLDQVFLDSQVIAIIKLLFIVQSDKLNHQIGKSLSLPSFEIHR